MARLLVGSCLMFHFWCVPCVLSRFTIFCGSVIGAWSLSFLSFLSFLWMPLQKIQWAFVACQLRRTRCLGGRVVHGGVRSFGGGARPACTDRNPNPAHLQGQCGVVAGGGARHSGLGRERVRLLLIARDY